MHRPASFIVLGLIAAGLSACGESGTSSAGAPAGGAAWLLATAPADALSVREAKAGAVEGQTIAVRGRIGGRKAPISADSPVFVIVDLALPHCGQNPDDNCPTPWDYCCEKKEDIAANSATVQIVGADGGGETVAAVGGALGPLDEVVVVGTVGPRPNPGVLTIRATGVHRVGG